MNKIVDNTTLYFDFISNNLNEGNFYLIEVIKRKKNGHKKNSDISYFILDDLKDYNKVMNKAIELADYYNARVYGTVNQKSYKKVAYNMNLELAKILNHSNYKNVTNLFHSIAAKKESNFGQVYWVVDVDSKEDFAECNKVLSEFDMFPTLNGAHFITTPFDTRTIKPGLVDKNRFTLIYYKEKEE